MVPERALSAAGLIPRRALRMETHVGRFRPLSKGRASYAFSAGPDGLGGSKKPLLDLPDDVFGPAADENRRVQRQVRIPPNLRGSRGAKGPSINFAMLNYAAKTIAVLSGDRQLTSGHNVQRLRWWYTKSGRQRPAKNNIANTNHPCALALFARKCAAR